jgi:hypothetical protein
MLACLTVQVIHIWTWPVGGAADEAVFHYWAGAVSVVLLVVAGLVALLVVMALRGGPRILLTPNGVMQDDWRGNRVVPWKAWRPGRPLRHTRRHTLTLIIDRPELAVRRGPFRGSTRRPGLNLTQLRVDPWFLADAIWFYVDHPDRRDAIGGRAEYEHLLLTLDEVRGRQGSNKIV